MLLRILFIRRPYQHLFPLLVNGLDGVGGGRFLFQGEIVAVQLRRVAEGGEGQIPGLNLRVGPLDIIDQLILQGDQDALVFHAVCLDRLHRVVRHLLIGSFAFQLDEQNPVSSGSLQRLFQSRNGFPVDGERLDFLQCHLFRFPFLSGDALEIAVVVKDIVAVFRPLNVDFASVGADFPCLFQARDGVLRPFGSAGAMGDDAHLAVLRKHHIKLPCHHHRRNGGRQQPKDNSQNREGMLSLFPLVERDLLLLIKEVQLRHLHQIERRGKQIGQQRQQHPGGDKEDRESPSDARRERKNLHQRQRQHKENHHHRRKQHRDHKQEQDILLQVILPVRPEQFFGLFPGLFDRKIVQNDAMQDKEVCNAHGQEDQDDQAHARQIQGRVRNDRRNKRRNI